MLLIRLFSYQLSFFFLASPLFAADFLVGISSGQQGVQVLLPINLVSDPDPVAIQFDVIYSGEDLVSDPVISGSAASTHIIQTILQTEGRRRVIIFSRNNIPIGDGVIVEIPFNIDIDANPGIQTVSLTNLVAADGTANLVATNVSAGSVTVQALVELEPTLGGVTITPQGAFQFELNATAGTTFRIEVSSDLVNWVVLDTVSISGGPVMVDDPDADSFDKRFYRAVEIVE